jgi:hypothetical protein
LRSVLFFLGEVIEIDVADSSAAAAFGILPDIGGTIGMSLEK